MTPERDPADDATRPNGAGRRRALLVTNAKARRGRAEVEGLVTELEAAGLAVEIGACEPAEIDATIRAYAGSVDLVVVGGGDGTVSGAGPAVADTGLPLAILPLGTANDLARTLGIPADPRAAARVAATGLIRRIDLGEANGAPFFNVASIGISVEVARTLTREMKRRWGALGYAVATAQVVARLRPFDATIRVEGEEHRVRSVQIGVGNGRHYGGGLTIEENAAPDDGRLDVYTMDVRGWWELPLLYPAFRLGRHGTWKNVHTWSTAGEVEIVTDPVRSVNTDGEIRTRTPVRFRLRPGAVQVVCPSGPTESP